MKAKEFKEFKKYVQSTIDEYDEQKLDGALQELEDVYDSWRGPRLSRLTIKLILDKYDVANQLACNDLIRSWNDYDYPLFDELTSSQQNIIENMAKKVHLMDVNDFYGSLIMPGYIPLDYYSVFCKIIKTVSNGACEGYEFIE